MDVSIWSISLWRIETTTEEQVLYWFDSSWLDIYLELDCCFSAIAWLGVKKFQYGEKCMPQQIVRDKSYHFSIKKSEIIFPFHHWLEKSLFTSIQHWYCAEYYCVLFCTYWLYKYIVVYVIKSGVYKTELGKKVPKIIKEIDLVVNQHTRQTTTYKYLTTNLCFVPVPFVVYYYY